MRFRTPSVALSIRSLRIAIALTVAPFAAASCGETVTYAHEISDCQAIPDQSSEIEPRETLDGYPYFCGHLLPDLCVQLGEERFATLTVEADRVTIDYLGDRARLTDTCSEDLGVALDVVSTQALEVPASLPVYFEGSKLDPIE